MAPQHLASDDHPVLIYSTFPDVEAAKKTASELVAARLAACVNILPQMVSVYRWEGSVSQDDEVVLIAKTRSQNVDAVTSAINASHPYDLPAVVALPVVGGSMAFCQWILSETDSAQ